MTCSRTVNITATTNYHHPRKTSRWTTIQHPLPTPHKTHLCNPRTSCQPTSRHVQTNYHPTTTHNPLRPEKITNPGEAMAETPIETTTETETEITTEPTMTDDTTAETIATTDLTTDLTAITTIVDHNRGRATATGWEHEDTP